MAEERMLNDEILLGLIKANSGGGGGGTTDYDDLNNKPQINSVTLSGNKSASDLGLATDDDVQGILDGQSIDSFSDVESALAGKQDALTAGANINMTGNVLKAGVVEVVEPDMTVYGNSTESGSKTYTIESTGVYEIFYCLSLQSTVSVTLPNDANVLFESDLTVSSHPVKHIVAELHEGDTVTIAQTPSQWNAVVSGVLKLDAISVVNVAHTGSIADNTITYTLPNDNKYYLVVGACVGKPTGNNAVDSTSGGTPEITRTLTGSGVRFRSVVVKGSDSPSFSFYGYDGGVASIIAYEIEFEEGNWDYNLATKNYVDTALSGKQNTLTFDSVPTDGSTNPVESNGVYDALATKANASDVTTALALKQDATDNNLQTTSKTVVGAVNELKSGLTDLQEWTDADTKTVTGNPITIADAAAVNAKALSMTIEPVQNLHGQSAPYVGGAGKNKLPMTVDSIKALNTIGTWSGNTYTIYNATITLLTDDGGNITGIQFGGTPTYSIYFILCNYFDTSLYASAIYLNGCPANGSNETYQLMLYKYNGTTNVSDTGTGSPSFIISDSSAIAQIIIRSGVNTNNLVFHPMIRLATETDATFAPYTNYCPITGHTEASVERDGNDVWTSDSSYAIVGEGYIIPKTNISLPAGTYELYFDVSGQAKAFDFSVYKNNSEEWQNKLVSKVFDAKSHNIVNFTINEDGTNVRMYSNNPSGVTISNVRLYSTTQTYTITFGQTVYGCTVGFNTGKVRVTHGFNTYSTEDVDLWSDNFNNLRYARVLKPSLSADYGNYSSKGVSSRFLVEDLPAGGFDILENIGKMTGNTETTRYWIGLDKNITLSEAQSLIGGMQLCYELATPTELTLTPAQLELLKGHNTITANGATITLTYQPDNLVGEVMEQVDAEVDCAKAYTDSKVAAVLPTYPTTDGAYVLTATVTSGETVLSWESAT